MRHLERLLIRRARDRSRAAVSALLLCMYALSVVACDRPSTPELSDEPTHPNLVIVTLDTTRADHLGTWGYFRDTSPVLDALAEQSIVFENAWMPIATTLPSHLSVFTGTHPLEHGVLANTTHGGQRFVPAAGLRSAAVLAKEAGYATGACVSAAPLKRGSGIEHGFDHYTQPEEKYEAGDVCTEDALDWLERLEARRPFLLWVHYYDAHYPFEAPKAYELFSGESAQEARRLDDYLRDRRFAATSPRPLVGRIDETRPAIDLYDAEIRYQDDLLGQLLAALRALPDWDRTAVLVVGDHGEGLGQHGEAAHGGIWQEQLHAPLLMRVPGEEPRRVKMPVAAADVLPTFLTRVAAHAEIDFAPVLAPFLAQASGRDALAEDARALPILGQDTGRKLGVGHFPREDYRRSLTHQGFKYVRTDRVDGSREEALFDLGLDPFELEDAKARHPELLAQLSRRLDQEIEERVARGERLRDGREVETTPVDPQALAELCALGYLECEDGVPVDGSGD